MNSHHTYILKGDVRALSRARITSRKVLSHIQEQSIILSIELERQHADKPAYTGPLHLELEIYFTSDLPIYRQKKVVKASREKYSIAKPHISVLIGLIERIGEGILFGDGCSISSVNCTKKYTKEKEPYLMFKVVELKGKQ
jgi:hypothetical protein